VSPHSKFVIGKKGQKAVVLLQHKKSCSANYLQLLIAKVCRSPNKGVCLQHMAENAKLY